MHASSAPIERTATCYKGERPEQRAVRTRLVRAIQMLVPRPDTVRDHVRGGAGFVPTRYLSDWPVVAAEATTRRSSSARNAVSSGSAGSSGYYVGPRGGCYTYTASVRKRYVDRSNCR